MSYKSRKLKRINENNMPGAFRALGNLKYRVILEGIIVGLLVGVVISAFRFILSRMDILRNIIVGLAWAFLLFWYRTSCTRSHISPVPEYPR